MISEYISEKLRLRYRAMDRFDNGLDRPRLGESADERAARSALASRTGDVAPSPRSPRAVVAAEGMTEAE